MAKFYDSFMLSGKGWSERTTVENRNAEAAVGI